jgi:hypothetical protein
MSDQRPPHERLAEELEKLGAHQMADDAKDGYYGDFTSPLAMPISQLVRDLQRLGTPAALDLRKRAMNGEFDGE